MTTFQRATRVQVSFGTFFGTPTWDDVSQYVRLDTPITIDRGRPDQFSDIQPGKMTLTVNNRDGRFTVGNAASPYYPNVKIGKKVQVTSIYYLKNLFTNPDFEALGVTGWFAGGSVPPTVAQSGTYSWEGGYSGLVTWGTGGSFPSVAFTHYGLSIGATYTFSIYARVPTGSPSVQAVIGGIGTGATMSTKDAFTRMSITFVATATTHQTQVWPATAPTAGQQVYLDGAQLERGSSATTYDGTPAIYSDRFTGYVSSWPIGWNNGTTQDSRVTISALDQLRKFAQGAELQSMLAEEVLLSNPFAYYPLGEATGTASAGDVSGTNLNGVATPTQIGVNGTLTFGTQTGPGTDGLSAPLLTPANASNGLYLLAPTAQALTGQNVQSLECWFSTTATTGGMVAYCGQMSLSLTAGHKLQGSTGFGGNSLTSSASVNDGLTHHAVVTYDWAGTGTRTLWLDGVAVASNSAADAILSPATVVAGLSVGYSADTGSGNFVNSLLSNLTVAHVAAYTTIVSATDVARHYTAGTTGFVGESSDARISRLLDYVGVPTTERVIEAGLTTSMSAQPLAGVQPLAALQDVAQTESGQFYVDGSGNKVFHSRSHRYNQAAEFSADAAELADTVTFTIDDALLALAGNDVLATRPGGAVQRRTNQVSVDAYGRYVQNLTLLTTSDNEVSDRANWEVGRFGEPGPRCTNVTIDLVVTGQPDAYSDTYSAGYAGLSTALGLDISDRFTITGLPTATAPAANVDLMIEGSHEEITIDRDLVNFNCSNFASDSIWVLDDSDYSILDYTTILGY